MIHQIDRQTHISARNTCTHTPIPHSRAFQQAPGIAPALLQLSLTPFYPHPPGGGDVPEGTEDFGPFLSSAGSRVTSTAPSPRPGVPSWAPGTDTSALVGRTERASCPLSTLQLPPRLLPAASLQAVQVRGAGEARVWQRGCQGQARRDMGCRSVGSGHWLKPGYAPYLGSSAAHLLRAPWGWASRSSLDRENSLSSPVVTFSASKKTRGWLLQGPLVKMGGLYGSPGPTTGQSCGLRRRSTLKSLRAI